MARNSRAVIQVNQRVANLLDLFGLGREVLPGSASDEYAGDSMVEFLRQTIDPFSSYAQISSDRKVMYGEYDLMDQYGDIATACDIYAEEASQPDHDTEQVVWIESKDAKIKEAGQEMLRRIRANTKAWAIARNLAKYGDVFQYLLTNQTGVYNLQFIHPARVARVQTDHLLGFQCDDLAKLLFQTQFQVQPNEQKFFEPWDFVHWRIEADDRETIYGRPYIENVRKCYSDDTEILTHNRGWVLFKDLQKGEEVATRDTDTKQFEWQVPHEIVIQPYKGKMIALKSHSLDLLVTPNHRMLLKRTADKRTPYFDEEVIVDASTLVGGNREHARIPTTSKWVGVAIKEKFFAPGYIANAVNDKHHHVSASPSVTMSGNDYCAFMGAFLAEGNVNRGPTAGGIEIGQLPKSKGYGPYGQLISRIMGEPAKHYGKSFYLNRSCLVDHFGQFGKAKDKFIPDEILNATPNQLQLFWDYFVMGDGCISPVKDKTGKVISHRTQITTSSQRIADQLTEMAQKLGMWVTDHVRTLGRRLGPTGKWIKAGTVLHLLTVHKTQTASFRSITEQDYDGNIYCVGVPNGIVYVRRNGRPAWCGNTWKELQILETFIAVYRITKSVQRNIFLVDVGDSAPQEAKMWIERWRRHLRKAEIIDPVTGHFRVDVHALTVVEDLILPIRTGSSTKVEKLQADPDIGALEDLKHFRAKMRTNLGIPQSYFDQTLEGMGWNSKEALILQDQRFSRKITRLRDAQIAGWTRLMAIHLTLLDIPWTPDAWEIKMAPVNAIIKRLEQEEWLRIVQLLMSALGLAQAAPIRPDIWTAYCLKKFADLPDEFIKALVIPPEPQPMALDPETGQPIAAAPAAGGGGGVAKMPSVLGAFAQFADPSQQEGKVDVDLEAIIRGFSKKSKPQRLSETLSLPQEGFLKEETEPTRKGLMKLVRPYANDPLMEAKYLPEKPRENLELSNFRRLQLSKEQLEVNEEMAAVVKSQKEARKAARKTGEAA